MSSPPHVPGFTDTAPPWHPPHLSRGPSPCAPDVRGTSVPAILAKTCFLQVVCYSRRSPLAFLFSFSYSLFTMSQSFGPPSLVSVPILVYPRISSFSFRPPPLCLFPTVIGAWRLGRVGWNRGGEDQGLPYSTLARGSSSDQVSPSGSTGFQPLQGDPGPGCW